MKNLKLILALLTINLLTINVSAQVLCIYCYDQNDSISHGVNNLILNGGFENTTCNPSLGDQFCPNSISYNCDIANWTCTGGGIHTYAQLFNTTFSIIPEGSKAAYFGNWFAKACSPTANDTLCINNVQCSVNGIPNGYPKSIFPEYGGDSGISLKQTVNSLIIGNTYVLEFWAGGEFLGTKKGLFAVDVGFGDTLFRDKATRPTWGIGTRFIIEFRATSASHTIKFTNWGHICDSCTELVLDDVRLYTLAELDASVPHCVSSDGINETNANPTTSIYPNPATDEVTITTNNQSPSEVILYDITGRKLLHQSFAGSTTMNIAKLAKGIYLYEIRDKEGVVKNGKIVKE